MTGHDIVTEKGYHVPHYHFDQGFTEAQKDYLVNQTRNDHPCIIDVRGKPTSEFNCIGFAFDAGRSWVNPDQVERILADNEFELQTVAKVGDVIVYKLGGAITHAGGVMGADAAGNVTQVLSKWGANGLYLHPPDCVPDIYGFDISVWRPGKCPLRAATLGTVFVPVIDFLRTFRDEVVLQSSFKGAFERMLCFYYIFAPAIASEVRRNRWFKRLFRYFVAFPSIFVLGLAVLLLKICTHKSRS